MTKRTVSLIIVVALALLPITYAELEALPVSQAEEIKIGVVTARSGALGYYGDMEINGLILGLMYELNIESFETIVPNMKWKLTYEGKTIYIIAEDDIDPQTGVSSPSIAVQKARKLILDDGVHILQGCSSSDSAIALTSIAKQYGVVFIVQPAADSDITAKYFNKYVFQIASTTWHDAIAGGSYAIKLGKKVAFIAPDYSWGYSTVRCWSEIIEKKGGKVVWTEYAPLTTTDFTPYIQRILASGAEVLIPVWAGATAVYLFAALKTQGVYNAMNVTTGIPDLVALNFVLAQYLPPYGGMMKYCWNLPNNTVNDWLVNKYVELYKQAKLPTMGVYLPAFPLPDLFVGEGFAAGQAIARALKATKWNPSADALIKALEGMEFMSPKGKMKIRASDHRTVQEMYIAKVVYDNTTLRQYYESINYLPAIYWSLYNFGFMRPELVETTTAEPPVEVGVPAEIPLIPIIIIIVVAAAVVAIVGLLLRRKKAPSVA